MRSTEPTEVPHIFVLSTPFFICVFKYRRGWSLLFQPELTFILCKESIKIGFPSKSLIVLLDDHSDMHENQQPAEQHDKVRDHSEDINSLKERLAFEPHGRHET